MIDEDDVMRWLKDCVRFSFITVPVSLVASLVAQLSGWFEWPYFYGFGVALMTFLVVLVIHVIMALWDWSSS
ncbi:MAG: hypothetical protein ACYC2H_00575 [Thermoplasmatota archaeon]